MTENSRRDLQLVRSALRGSASARAELVERLRCIPRILHARNRERGGRLSRDELDDLTQDAFTQLWSKLERYEGRGPLEAWAYRFCRFAELNAWHKEKRRALPLNDYEEDAVVAEEPDLDRFERHDQVLQALTRIEPGDRAVIEARHFEAATFDEVGALLEISPNTAKTRYYRGLKRLQRLLRGHRDERGAGA